MSTDRRSPRHVIVTSERCAINATDDVDVAIVGLRDVVVFATPRAVIVCRADEEEEMREMFDMWAGPDGDEPKGGHGVGV